MTPKLAPLVAALVTIFVTATAAARPVRVIVPDPDNLQYLSFWVAKGAGLFRAEGIDVEVVCPPHPKDTTELVRRGEIDVFVLPPPTALELIAAREPIVLVASLLEKDPINVVVKRSVLEARKLSPTDPLDARVRGLRDMAIGVAPGPPTRLKALLASASMDPATDVKVVIVPGRAQNEAFREGRVDALYAHTPYLERALLDEDGVLLINQSAGEVKALATHQIHALAVRRRLREMDPALVASFVRGLARAEALIHASQAAAVDATLKEFPTMDRRHVELLVRIYEPAIPRAPSVSIDGLKTALTLFPASRVIPDLAGIDLSLHVDDSFARDAIAPPRSRGPARVLAACGAAVAAMLVLVVAVVRARRRQSLQ